jgi:type I restriction enzyme S subunit
MKKYSSYKPSGIKWLETIPENWEVSKLKYLGNLYGGLTGKSGGDFNNDENPKNKPYIPYTNIFNNTYISKDHFHFVSIDDGESQNRVKKYDMFFLMSSETHKDLGKSCILIDDVDELYLNSFCKGYRINNKDIQPLFLNYQILGHLHREMISIEGKGFTRINLRQDKINDLVVFYPPLQEQEQIVNYLNEKTNIIDKLISTKQRKVELLKEQRTSLINQVITKGLNPNVKMKDSGVEWIGEIPEEWNIVPLFTISRHTKEKNEDNEKVVLSLSYGKIKVRDVESNFGLLPESFNDYQRIRPEYIVLRLTDLQNDKKSLRVGLSTLNGIITPVYVSLKTNEKMLSKFLFYHLYNSDLKKILYTLGGGLRQTLRFDELKKFPVPLMSLVEQQKIIEYLDKQTKEIDDLVSMEQNKIELLKEYRQSLISEVITGKIKVV